MLRYFFLHRAALGDACQKRQSLSIKFYYHYGFLNSEEF